MRAVVYTRISKDDRKGTEDEGAGVARQEAACRDLCRRRGWRVVEVFTDNDVSASTRRPRPEFERMLAAAEAGEFDVMVCWHVDRLTRRLVELERLIELCERTGVKVATVSGDLDLSTDAGRLVGRILASVARGEVERKGARQRAAAEDAAAAGRALRGRLRMFGYLEDFTDLVPTEAEAIRQACRDILAGGAVRSIVRAWTEAGHQPTGESGAWSPQAVRGILRNPKIAGLATYRGEIVVKDGEPVRGEQPAIVDVQTWRSVRALLDDPDRRPPAGVRSLLSGEARCICGEVVWAGRSYHGKAVYKCSTYISGRRRPGEHVSRQAAPVDEFVSLVAIERLSRPDARDLLVAADRPDAETLRAELVVLDRRGEELAAEFADGAITRAQLRAGTERLQARAAEVGRMLNDARAEHVLGDLIGRRAASRWATLDLDRQRAVVRLLMTVTLLPPGMGRRAFDPATVHIGPPS